MESIEELIFIVISLLLLLMGVVLLGSIIMSMYNPYEQITMANVEKMRSTFNEICLTTPENPIKISFDMPQNTPFASWLFSVLPAWLIKAGGDPNYVLYYESFPPGEANGWEAYHSFQNRIITYLPADSEGMTEEDVRGAARCAVRKFLENNKGKPIDAVVFTNILLDDKHRSDFILKKKVNPLESESTAGAPASTDCKTDTSIEFEEWKTSEGDATKGFFGLGKWQGNFFKFKNYAGMSALEKTLIKYQLCGANSLCLKTREGVYTFPIEMCRNIKGIQLVYDARNRGKAYAITAVGIAVAVIAGKALIAKYGIKAIFSFIGKKLLPKALKFVGKHPALTVGGTALATDALISSVASNFASFKTSDFYLASPCTMPGKEVKKSSVELGDTTNDQGESMISDTQGTITETYDFEVRYTTCEEGITEGGWFGTANPKVCSNVLKYPLYKYDDNGKLEYIKDRSWNEQYHYVCVEKIGDVNNPEIVGNDPPESANSEYYGSDCIQVFAGTRPENFCWTDDGWKREAGVDWDTKLVSNILGLDSIRDSTAYITSSDNKLGDLLVLKHSELERSLLERSLERKFTWVWPK